MVLCIVLVAPLIAPSHLAGSTSVTAALGLAGVGLWALATVLLAVVAHFNGLYGKIPWWPPMHDLSLAAFVTQLLATLPVIATAYTCQMSVHFVMRELEGFGRGRMTLVSVSWSSSASRLLALIFEMKGAVPSFLLHLQK
jgi:amino acid permease